MLPSNDPLDRAARGRVHLARDSTGQEFQASGAHGEIHRVRHRHRLNAARCDSWISARSHGDDTIVSTDERSGQQSRRRTEHTAYLFYNLSLPAITGFNDRTAGPADRRRDDVDL